MINNRLIFLQNDWRIHDNDLLAVSDGNKNYLVACINSTWEDLINGFRMRSKQFEQFSRKSALEFQQKLSRDHNISCPLCHGSPLELIRNILSDNPQITILRIAKPVAYDEQQVINAIQQYFPQLKIELIWTNALFEPEALGFDELQYKKSFTAWRKKVKQLSLDINPVRIQLKTLRFGALKLAKTNKQIEASDKAQELSFPAGESAALRRLHYYLFQSNKIDHYKQTRNQLLGLDYSSKFSPYLAHGALSAKHIYQEITRYEVEVNQNESTDWLKFELLWREYFKHAMYTFKRHFFLLRGLQNHIVQYNTSKTNFLKWSGASTENSFVNANMIELNQTGYMSNRGRQNVASYLIHNLQQDWRLGAAYFESMLIDYDVSSNWCNWAYLAGVGNDPRSRIFNLTKQRRTYDPNHDYINYWLKHKT